MADQQHPVHPGTRAGHIMNAILTIVSVISLIASGFAVYNSMDKRLTIVETTQHIATEANIQMRKDFHDQFSSINNKLDRLTQYLMDNKDRN